MDKIVHFEIPFDDAERATAFYAETFGWQINSVPGMGYHMVTTTEIGDDYRPKEPGAINGGMLERCDPVRAPVVTINVDDINAAVKRVEASGGEIVRDPQKVGDMGIAAYFKDPEGNVLGLWQATGG